MTLKIKEQATNDRRAWMVRITERETLCESESIIAIGWAHSGGFREMSGAGAIKRHISDKYHWYKPRGLGNVAGTVWRFVHEIQPGDIVAVVSGNKSGFRVARVLEGQDENGRADYRSELIEYDSAWCRPVEYLTGWLSRSKFLPGRVQSALKGQQTCLEKTQYLEVFERVANEQEPVNDLSDELTDALAQEILEKLRSHLSDRQLESLVCDLVIRSGATKARRPARSSQKPGDVDVEALYSVQYGAGEKTPRIWYQVKQHRGESDEHAVKQLTERNEADASPEDVVAMVVVSTADTFSKEAEQLAHASDVELMSGRDLVEWILKTGLGVPSSSYA